MRHTHTLEMELLIFNKMELELINFELELKFATNFFYPQINLLFNFLIQKYFFRDHAYLEYKLLRVGNLSTYSNQWFE